MEGTEPAERQGRKGKGHRSCAVLSIVRSVRFVRPFRPSHPSRPVPSGSPAGNSSERGQQAGHRPVRLHPFDLPFP
ncbi:hypothetical protein L249_6311 [Ophiocordyceps polyrhachis-furcata BCC 54312]|uniref:Uncharacterized protein n=1 Tax=Ophiocordyceps polyrhachis-furcata BCC 54312 TaxID=1330021 RepID=A0A367L138_9HYPO|nr:hypothetical protein L249_6311 [Ophiocordyceps polyrhachis-furcata BCC 54312]